MEEAMVHEHNFRESITMLVVQDAESSGSEKDSDVDPAAHRNLEHIKEKSRFEKVTAFPTLGNARHGTEATRGGLRHLDKYDPAKEFGETEALLKQ